MKYFICILFFSSFQVFSQEKMIYPFAKTVNQVDTIWGKAVADPYRWMENRADTTVTAWLKNQKKIEDKYYTAPYRSMLAKIDLYSSIKHKGVYKVGKYFFSFYYESASSTPTLYYSDKEDGELIRLFDPNAQSWSDKISLADLFVSDDNKYLALTLVKNGGDWQTIRFLNMETHNLLKDEVDFSKYGHVYWYKNGVFYARYDVSETDESLKGAIKGRKLYYHILGTNQSEDKLVFKLKGDELDFHFYRTPEAKYLVLGYSKPARVATYTIALIPLNDSLKFIPHTFIIDKSKNCYFDVLGELGGKLMVSSNLSAPNGAIFKYNPNGINQRELFIDQYTQRLNSADLIGNKLLLTYEGDKQYRAEIKDSTGKLLKSWRIPEGSVFSSFSGGMKDTVVYYSFNSFYHPASYYKISLNTFVNEPRGHTEVNFSNKDLITEKVYYYSKDSTQVAMYLTHKKSLKPDGNNPTLLEGYGGFGISTEPYFSASNMVFLNSGGILANPCIRGGGDKPGWHEAGIGLKKQNSFDDFIAAAEYLIRQKYTNPKKIAIKGGSNGGLLVGACMLQRPDLFKLVICESGVLDLLRMHLYNVGYLHLYKSEYGSIKDSASFTNMYKLSPVNNVKTGVDYPAILVIASENDDRVNAFQSFKFVAEIQARSSGTNPCVLYYQNQAGHSGSEVLQDWQEASAYVFSFIFRTLDMKLSEN